ncbi:inositol-phosphate phosphatase [Methylomonas lenta]|uniref:Inositol-phosphate phosphatase n=1 Tax=Methylomonas lenta TaxID=980561 RepID=A0A177NMQ5_9GAMM|nr:inositol monophosphatase family protein [Methylomonas lenta]OAI19416.1 inositol-phosphate phosphatase [Methylomonas lenta]
MELSCNDLFLLSQCAISAACQAGHAIAKYSRSDLSVSTKDGGASLAAQVVTEVDHLSQAIILQTLLPTCEMFDLALLSEESPDDGERLNKDFFWSIDPLDGTLPFIEGVPGYSVSIALVSRAGEPIIGVVYDPLTQTVYHAIMGQGAWKDGQPLKPIELSKPAAQTLLFLTDKSFAQDPLYPATLIELDYLATELGYAGAALKLQGGAAMNACQVLTTKPACYFKFPKPQVGGGSIWDYAATACLFNEVGLPFSDALGRTLVLNPEGSTFMNHCGVLYCHDQDIADRMIRAYNNLSQIKKQFKVSS